MKKMYKFLGMLMIGVQVNAQVYEVAAGGYYFPGGVSDNGIVSLYLDNVVYKWDSATGLSAIGTVSNGFNFAGGVSVSNDGTKISATVTNPETNINEMSLYNTVTENWSHSGGLGYTVDGTESSAWGISGDGSTIVGLGWNEQGGGNAIKWDAENGITDLGSMISGRSSRANDINDDKTVVVGWQDREDGYRAGAKWVNGVESYILNSSGENTGAAVAVSADGNTIVGGTGYYPYVWNATTGYQEIAHPNSSPFYRGVASGVSGDGKKVIGYYRVYPLTTLFGEGFIWTAETGRVNLNNYVESLGIDTKGITLSLPLAISKDGTKIAGTETNTSNQIVAFYIDLTSALSAHTADLKKLSVYPNPVKDVLHISTDKKIESIEIYNLAGQKIKSFKAAQQADVSSLAKGVYILKVTVAGNTEMLKFIKE